MSLSSGMVENMGGKKRPPGLCSIVLRPVLLGFFNGLGPQLNIIKYY